MLKIVFSGLMAGLLTFACTDVFAQAPVPDRNKEFWMGAGLTRPDGFGTAKTVFTPRFILKVAKNKWHRRYSLLLSYNSTANTSNEVANEIDTELKFSESFFNAAIGIGAERRFSVGQRAFFYLGHELSVVASLEKNRSIISTLPVVPEDGWISDYKRSYFRPGLSLNLIAGFHYDPLSRISVSIEVGPGIQGTLNFTNDQSKNTYAPGTPSQQTVINSDRALDMSTSLRLLAPVFVQVGYRF